MNHSLHLAIMTVQLAASSLGAATHYVSLEGTNPTPPYTSWATAATNIQDAVNVSAAHDVVVVTNGVYPGAVTVTNPLMLLSANGPQFTVIDGGGTNRCVSLAEGASLTGFTLTNGHGYYVEGGGGAACGSTHAFLTNCTITGNWANLGGGVYGGTLYNCTLTGNRAVAVRVPVGLSPGAGGGACDSTLYNCILTSNSAAGLWIPSFREGGGGGVYGGTLYNCTLIGNSAEVYGGGSRGGTLNNCTVSGNSAGTGGGVYYSKLNNCIVHFNTATSGDNYIQDQYTPLLYCCTTPVPTNGVGNIDADPKFVNAAGGDFRLRPDSPCIDAGTNLSDNISTDILGNTRFIDGNGDSVLAWDIGAYEFNSFKPPRFIGSPQRTEKGWKLSITGEPDKWTSVQRTSNLRDWGDIWSGFMPADGLKQITDTETNQMMLYRAVVP